MYLKYYTIWPYNQILRRQWPTIPKASFCPCSYCSLHSLPFKHKTASADIPSTIQKNNASSTQIPTTTIAHLSISLAAAGKRALKRWSESLTLIGAFVIRHAARVGKSTATLLAGIRFLAVRRASSKIYKKRNFSQVIQRIFGYSPSMFTFRL